MKKVRNEIFIDTKLQKNYASLTSISFTCLINKLEEWNEVLSEIKFCEFVLNIDWYIKQIILSNQLRK